MESRTEFCGHGVVDGDRRFGALVPSGTRGRPFAQTPPQLLYHYTSVSGVEGILSTGRIWATHVAYLNDTTELRFGLDIAGPVFKRRVTELTGVPWNQTMIDAFTMAAADAEVYVACFCESGDLLGQWRGYASDGGFALGFETATSASRTASYRKVTYGEPSELAEIHNAAEDAAIAFARGVDREFSDSILAIQTAAGRPKEAVEALAKAMYNNTPGEMWHLAAACAQVKHPAFAAELEWRLVSGGSNETGAAVPVRFRDGSFGATPYTEIDIRGSADLAPLREVVVGPGSDVRLRVRAVETMLSSLGYDAGAIDVHPSAVPYRWN